MKGYSILLLFVAVFISCKKQSLTPVSTPWVDKNLDFLTNAVTDSCNENGFYIKGEFNGKKLCFATTGPSGNYYVDTFVNAFYTYNLPTYHDNLYLIRGNASRTINMEIYCGQTHIKNRVLPYYQPNSNLENCEFTTFQLINNLRDFSITQNSPQDYFSFNGYTSYIGSLTVTKLTTDNIIEANFETTLKSNAGSVIIIKNGKQRIKFVVINQN